MVMTRSQLTIDTDSSDTDSEQLAEISIQQQQHQSLQPREATTQDIDISAEHMSNIQILLGVQHLSGYLVP